MMRPLLACLVGPAAVAVGFAACSFAPSDARIGIDAPSFQEFTATTTRPPSSAADFLVHRCGSLDCHGNPQRNLQLWGCEGQRLPVEGGVGLPPHPGCPASGGTPTTPEEYYASYRSLVSLEPAVMTSIVKAGAMGNPDLLTFVRKARGEEQHKGGMLVVPGDDQDVCMTAWITGPSNLAACTSAIATTP